MMTVKEFNTNNAPIGLFINNNDLCVHNVGYIYKCVRGVLWLELNLDQVPYPFVIYRVYNTLNFSITNKGIEFSYIGAPYFFRKLSCKECITSLWESWDQYVGQHDLDRQRMLHVLESRGVDLADIDIDG